MGETNQTTTIINLIKKQTCFSQLTAEETEILSTLFVERDYKPGDTIVTKGDPVDSVYLIYSGEADVQISTVVDNKIETKSVATLGPEQAIGLNETGFYSISGIRTATVKAITDMKTFRLSVAAFNGFALAHHHVSQIMRRNAMDFQDNNE